MVLKQTGETGQHFAGKIGCTASLVQAPEYHRQKAKLKALLGTFSPVSSCYISSLNQLSVCWIQELQFTPPLPQALLDQHPHT